jgi:asparagine N-glycosylation enzyme membrane subunit Stt3
MILNILSLLIGLVAGVIAMFGIIPFVGWANWFVLPIAGLGLLLGLISSRKEGRILNIVVIAVALVRLSIGGGLI